MIMYTADGEFVEVICDAIKQNESEVEKYQMSFFACAICVLFKL